MAVFSPKRREMMNLCYVFPTLLLGKEAPPTKILFIEEVPPENSFCRGTCLCKIKNAQRYVIFTISNDYVSDSRIKLQLANIHLRNTQHVT